MYHATKASLDATDLVLPIKSTRFNESESEICNLSLTEVFWLSLKIISLVPKINQPASVVETQYPVYIYLGTST